MKLLAFIFLREEITWLKFVSMILIGIGTYLMIQKKETKEKAEDKKWQLYESVPLFLPVLPLFWERLEFRMPIQILELQSGLLLIVAGTLALLI